METSLADLNSGLPQGDGTYDGQSMTDIISGGYFVDSSTIPLLKDSGDFTTTTAGANVYQVLAATIVNYAWRKQNV